jgi:hypothetical protein
MVHLFQAMFDKKLNTKEYEVSIFTQFIQAHTKSLLHIIFSDINTRQLPYS